MTAKKARNVDWDRMPPRPCPWCGCNRHVLREKNERITLTVLGATLECLGCGAEGPTASGNDGARSLWQRRADDPLPAHAEHDAAKGAT